VDLVAQSVTGMVVVVEMSLPALESLQLVAAKGSVGSENRTVKAEIRTLVVDRMKRPAGGLGLTLVTGPTANMPAAAAAAVVGLVVDGANMVTASRATLLAVMLQLAATAKE